MAEPRNAEDVDLDKLMDEVLPAGELPPPPRHVAAIFFQAGAASRQGEVDLQHRGWQMAEKAQHAHYARVQKLEREVERLRKVCHDSSAVIENVLDANRNRDRAIGLVGTLAALALALHGEWTGR